jgi:hypothetical protein
MRNQTALYCLAPSPISSPIAFPSASTELTDFYSLRLRVTLRRMQMCNVYNHLNHNSLQRIHRGFGLLVVKEQAKGIDGAASAELDK